MAKIKEYDVDGNEVIRDLTDDEIAQNLIDHKFIEDQEKLQKKSSEAKAALLKKLGITADEAKLLLG